MKAYRRRRQQYLLASLLAVLGVINLLFFFILYRPVRSEYFTLQDSIQKTRTDIRTRQYNIERLEKLNVQLETSSQDKFRLYTMHFIPKEMGWSRIVPELDAMIQKAGVKNTRKDYNLDDKPEFNGIFLCEQPLTKIVFASRVSGWVSSKKAEIGYCIVGAFE